LPNLPVKVLLARQKEQNRLLQINQYLKELVALPEVAQSPEARQFLSAGEYDFESPEDMEREDLYNGGRTPASTLGSQQGPNDHDDVATLPGHSSGFNSSEDGGTNGENSGGSHELASISVVDSDDAKDEKGNAYTVYIIHYQHRGLWYAARLRHSALTSLHEQLKKVDSTVGELPIPPKRPFGSRQSHVIARRVHVWDDYLQTVIASEVTHGILIAALKPNHASVIELSETVKGKDKDKDEISSTTGILLSCGGAVNVIGENAYTVYKISVTVQNGKPLHLPEEAFPSGCRFTVLRRYSEFREMEKWIAKKLPTVKLPPLPSRQWRNQIDMAVVNERKKEFDTWLRAASSHLGLLNDDHMRHFLKLDESHEL
jgi:hypothetical protein